MKFDTSAALSVANIQVGVNVCVTERVREGERAQLSFTFHSGEREG